ncbi:MAG: glycosyltransferase family 4 protein, partial [Bilophila sp.]
AVKRVAWWGLFWRNRNLACVAHRGVIYRPGNPLPYLSPAMKAFIVNSEACARAIRWHCPASKIHVVPNGIPDARVTPSRSPAALLASLHLSDTTFLFAYVGNDNPAKGTEILLNAFAKAAIPDAKLLLIGTSKRWEPLCTQLGIDEQVLHVGKTENVSDYLQICGAFVFPSKDMDSAPNTLLEAIRMGLPVVATAVGGVPEIVANNGLLVPPGTMPALAEALRAMVANPDQRAIWAKNSLARGAHFTMRARCEALEAIYQSVL